MPRIPAEPTANSDEAARVLRQFRIVFNAVRKHFRATERKAGISGAHIWALSVIGDHPSIGVGGLALAMDVHQSTASNLLRGLVSEELVVAQKDEADKRAVRLTVTPKGHKILRAAPHPYAGVLPDALQKLESRTLKRMERDLNELIELLDPDREGARRPLGAKD